MTRTQIKQIGLLLAENPTMYQAVLDAMSEARNAQRLELEKQKAALEIKIAELGEPSNGHSLQSTEPAS